MREATGLTKDTACAFTASPSPAGYMPVIGMRTPRMSFSPRIVKLLGEKLPVTANVAEMAGRKE